MVKVLNGTAFNSEIVFTECALFLFVEKLVKDSVTIKLPSDKMNFEAFTSEVELVKQALKDSVNSSYCIDKSYIFDDGSSMGDCWCYSVVCNDKFKLLISEEIFYLEAENEIFNEILSFTDDFNKLSLNEYLAVASDKDDCKYTITEQ